MEKIYTYGMRLRGFSPGAQPMENLIGAYEDPTREYWSILEYSAPLTAQELQAYELDSLGEKECWYRAELL